MKFVPQLMIALLSASALCQYALAEGPAPRVEKYPEARVGDKFSYVNGVFLIKCNSWAVKEANKNGEIVSKCGENSVAIRAENGNAVRAVNDKGDTVADFDPFFPELSFPLFVGKKWSGKFKGHDGKIPFEGVLSCEAAAYEPIQIAAGKFDTFRIECTNNYSSMIFIRGNKKSTSWYSPTARKIVKSVNEDPKWSFEVAATEVQ